MARETYRQCRRPDGTIDLVAKADLEAWVKKYRPDRIQPRVKMPKKIMRGSWICVPGPDGRTKFIPKHEFVRTSKGAGLQVIKDIEPYQNTVDRGVIGGRAQHREFLRANKLIEMGDQAPRTPPAPPANRVDMGLVQDIKRAMGKL